MMSDTLYVILYIPLVDKSLQFHQFRIQNIPLVHPILQKSFRYSIQTEYFAIRSDEQYISFPLSTDIMACQVANFITLTPPLYAGDTSNSCNYAHFLLNRDK